MQGKKFIALFICVILFVFPLVAAATEEAEDPATHSETEEVIAEDTVAEAEVVEAEEQPQGLGLLMFLLGIFGVLIVGGAAIGTDRFMALVDEAAPSNQAT